MAGVLTCVGIFDRCGIQKRHNGLLFSYQATKIYAFAKFVNISVQKLLETLKGKQTQTSIYIQNYHEQTARLAVCPLIDHVTFLFSHKHLSARKDGKNRE